MYRVILSFEIFERYVLNFDDISRDKNKRTNNPSNKFSEKNWNSSRKVQSIPKYFKFILHYSN